MMNRLELVCAGAGSGKTYDLCETVALAVKEGLDPARILATTFTKKAAAELKSRIQAKLLAENSNRQLAQQQVDRLELAAIGTVHSVARLLLSRYAIEIGLSPHLKVIEEQASDKALRDLLGISQKETWQRLVDCAERLDLSDIPSLILDLLAAKRGNRICNEDFISHMRESAERLCELLEPNGAAKESITISHLGELAEEALNMMPVTDATKETREAKQKLRELKIGSTAPWSRYLIASRIQAGKKSGANAMLETLRSHASEVRRSPQLHADIKEFSLLLAQETAMLEMEYKAYKAQRGLVDFTDLEINLLDLLENKQLAEQLVEDFDLVLVDEFQDTNPLQLAIFQRLRNFVPRNRWVGDPKQAIYGFRNTDPELVNVLWNNTSQAKRTRLPANFRSQQGLVTLIGRLFHTNFGADVQQKAFNSSHAQGVERWILEAKNKNDSAIAIACGIAQLHLEGMRFGDLALLERTNQALVQMAAALDDLGIPYLLESPGLLSSREGALVMAGLRLVADRRDSLAAATIMHLLGDPNLDTPDWIQERLEAVRKFDCDSEDQELVLSQQIPWKDHLHLSALEKIDHKLLAPVFVMQQVIEALNLMSLVPRWGAPARRSSNLDSLLLHAKNYEMAAIERGKAVTLSGLIYYLEKLEADQLDFRYPSQGQDAVTLMTYHSAKGLEWPVVILSGLNYQRDPSMWSPVVTSNGHNIDDPLCGRTLRYWLWPFGTSGGEFPKPNGGSSLNEDALKSLEGQKCLQQDNDESLRLLYVGCTRAKNKLIFAHRLKEYAWLGKLDQIDVLLNPALGAGEHALPDIGTSFIIRQLHAGMRETCQLCPKLKENALSIATNSNSAVVPRTHSPSQAAKGLERRPCLATYHLEAQTSNLPGPSYFPEGVDARHYADLGNALHSYLAALPSLHSLDDHEKENVAERCLAAYNVTGMLPPSILVSTGERFCRWIESNFADAQWFTEIAVTSPRTEGGQWVGTIDLALQLPDGSIVIVDHKSAPIRREYCMAKASEFSGQLAAYAEILQSAGKWVTSGWIHFPLAGVMVKSF